VTAEVSNLNCCYGKGEENIFYSHYATKLMSIT